MITVHLQGGIGNQMFQYALGRERSLHHSTELRLNTRHLHNPDGTTSYELGHFQLYRDVQIVDEDTPSTDGLLSSIIKSITNSPPLGDEFSFSSASAHAQNGAHLDGLFQSEAYFASIAPTIRNDFVPSVPLSHTATFVLDMIRECTCAVSIHVRRGNYVGNEHLYALYGTLSVEYYKAATEYFLKRQASPRWIIFSDDIEWCRQQFTFVEGAGYVEATIAPHEQITLMSLCHHHIIANSTLSWWGAWLNPSTRKVVVAPRHWLNNSVKDTSSIVPASWVKI